MLKSRAGKRTAPNRRKSRPGAARNRRPTRGGKATFSAPPETPNPMPAIADLATGGTPNAPVVSVVIPVVNERRTIARVVQEAFRIHRSTEVIVVANGTTDGSGKIAESLGARVLYYPSALGHDVGRSIGAREARGKIIVFTDGDIVISAKEIMPLVKAIDNGVDIALNSYLGPTDKMSVHGVVLAKHALNIALSRPELKGASMTTIPHALSRRALEAIGWEHLAIPPKAQTIGICRGLDVRAVHHIEVGRTNPKRRKRMGKHGDDPLEGLIVGDHLEALDWYIRATNERGNKPDLTRARESVR
ncbi:glycosyltransferase family 2 protein [Paenibacillus hodogayensis]|uniref:Glycosyltransferase family 2 protein n=2 Tax=Paenibacillus hodogayensis TaxID=279208 RepID=A0ABV5VSZ8_9BACL